MKRGRFFRVAFILTLGIISILPAGTVWGQAMPSGSTPAPEFPDPGPQELKIYEVKTGVVPSTGEAVYQLASTGDGAIRVTVVPLSGNVDLSLEDAQGAVLAVSVNPGTEPESVILEAEAGTYSLSVVNGAGRLLAGTEFLILAVYAEPASPYLQFDLSMVNAGDREGIERRFERAQPQEVRADSMSYQRKGYYVNVYDLPRRRSDDFSVMVTPEGEADLDLVIVAWDQRGEGTIWESRDRGTEPEFLSVPIEQRFQTFVIWVEAAPGTRLPAGYTINIDPITDLR